MELLLHNDHIVICLALIAIVFSWHCEAQSTISTIRERQLDSLLQDYAFRAFIHPHTGIPYDAPIPSNHTGIKLAVLRLRSGSLRNRGFQGYKEFDMPTGVIVQPYVKRLVFVYQNLGNWSSFYYPLLGYTHLTPVLGLLAYNAANLSATNLSELDIMASSSPMAIKFQAVKPVPSGYTAKCVRFNLNGSVEFIDLVLSNVCLTLFLGHYSIVVNSSGIAPALAPSLAPAPTRGPSPNPSPTPVLSKDNKYKEWKVVAFVVGGLVGLILLSLLLVWLASYRKKRKLEIHKREDVGEVLQMEQVGNTRLPVAAMTRTQPVIEKDYVP